jgi:tetratricopeptide (TPR) repeat protein
VKANSGRYQLVEGFPCNDGAICWRQDVCELIYTKGKLEGTIRSYNFRATHAVVFDYHLEVERVDDNNALYRVDPGFNPETHKAHRLNLAEQSGIHSGTTPTTGESISAIPSVIEISKNAKQLNAEGLRILATPHPDFNDAKRAFEKAVQLEPNNVEALNNLGYVYDRLGDYGSAEPILVKVIELAPTRKAAQGNLGEVQAKLGKTQEAANHFCQYVRMFSSLEHGKSLLARTFNDPDPNVQSAVNSTLANCN